MKSINFTDEELDHLCGYYQNELEEALKDVERIKALLSKFGNPKSVKPEITPEKKLAKRGRKPKVVVEGIPVPEVKRGPVKETVVETIPPVTDSVTK